MGIELPFDQIRETIKQHLAFSPNPEARTITLEFKGTIYEEMPFGDMFEDEEGLQRMAKNFMDQEIHYTTEPLPEGKGVILHFDSEEEYQKMFKFIDGILNGDLLEDIMQKIMKSMFSAFEEDRSEFDNTT